MPVQKGINGRKLYYRINNQWVDTNPAVTTTPSVPLSVTRTSAGTEAVISWQPPTSDGGSAITGYRVARDGSDGSGDGPLTIDVSAADRSYTFLDLVAGDTYTLTVAAINANGVGVVSSGTVTVPADLRPASPTTIPTVTNVMDDRATISWQSLSGATAYVVQITTTSSTAFRTIYNGPDLSIVETGLLPSTDYYVRYRGSNAAGTSPVWSSQRPFTTTGAPAVGNVQPFSAKKLRSMSGVDIHPNASSGKWAEYLDVDSVMDAVDRLGATWIRGMAVPGHPISDQYAAACVARGIGWCMTTAPTESTPDTTLMRNKVLSIANDSDYATCCIALEGLNEPNNGAAMPAEYNGDWAVWATDMQRELYVTAKNQPELAAVEIVGTSLHQLAAKNSGGQHYARLKNAGILAYQDTAGIHCYPNGLRPMNNMDLRFALMRDEYGANYPMRMTEFGYTTTTTAASGNTTTKQAMGIYGPRAYLQICAQQGIPMSWYEMLDDVDATGNDIQSHYGLINTPQVVSSSWTDKPAVATISALLTAITDPISTPNYTPNKITMTVEHDTPDVDWVCVATKAQSDAGTATAFLFRDVDVANGVTNITVGTVPVVVTDRVGSRTVQVGPQVLAVALR